MLPACQSPVEGAVSKHSSGQLFKGEELASPHTEQEMREAQPRQRAHSDPESHTLASIKKISYNNLSCFKQLSLWLCYIIFWAGGGGGLESFHSVFMCAHIGNYLIKRRAGNPVLPSRVSMPVLYPQHSAWTFLPEDTDFCAMTWL